MCQILDHDKQKPASDHSDIDLSFIDGSAWRKLGTLISYTSEMKVRSNSDDTETTQI